MTIVTQDGPYLTNAQLLERLPAYRDWRPGGSARQLSYLATNARRGRLRRKLISGVWCYHVGDVTRLIERYDARQRGDAGARDYRLDHTTLRRLVTLAQRLVALDDPADPSGIADRRRVSLTDLIEQAREALVGLNHISFENDENDENEVNAG